MKLPRFLSKLIPNYEIIDMKEWPAKGVIEIYFKKEDSQAPMICSVCGTTLGTHCHLIIILFLQLLF